MAERILVVEDSPTQREALRYLLVEAGFSVDTARSGEEALERVQGGPPFDAVLSDIVMPGMTGYDFCRATKDLLRDAAPPVILLTTLSDPADIVRGLECGADNYVTKPYDPEHLLQRIRRVLANRALRQAAGGDGAVDVEFMGETFSISAGKDQILDMLLSSFEELVHTANALRRNQAELAHLHTEAEDRAERLARLQSVTEALSRAGTPSEVLRVAVAAAREFLGADAAVAALARDDGSLEVVEAIGYGTEVTGEWTDLPPEAGMPLAEAARIGSEVAISNRGELMARYPVLESAKNEATLAAPFLGQGQTLGAYAVSFLRPRTFHEVDRQFFLTLTRQCAQALDRSRLFEAERQARAEAEEANRAKAQFLATMSHDLRTPLNAIGGYVDLIDLGIRGPVTDAQRADLERIRRSQKFLLALINDILNFARLEAGTVVYDIAPVWLSGVFRDVDLMVRPQMESKGLIYSSRPCDPDVAVAVDREKLQQVLLNLATNALKFTPSGGTVEMHCEMSDSGVQVTVTDSGVGIPAEKLDSIFDPFVQAHRAGDARDGVGLGLAISRELVRGMQGDLGVESRVDHGSTFILTIPRAERASG